MAAADRVHLMFSRTSCYLCSEWLDDDDVTEHLEICGRQETTCPLGCGVVVLRKHLRVHRNTCPGEYGDAAAGKAIDVSLSAMSNMNRMQPDPMEELSRQVVSPNDVNGFAEIIHNYMSLSSKAMASMAETFSERHNQTVQILHGLVRKIEQLEAKTVQYGQPAPEATALPAINGPDQAGPSVKRGGAVPENVQREQAQMQKDIKQLMETQDQICSRIEKMYAGMVNMSIEHNELRQSIESKDGRVIWVIESLAHRLRKASPSGLSVSGPIFFNAPFGYRLQVCGTLVSGKKRAGPVLQIRLALRSGRYDDVLKWPVSFVVTVRMMMKGPMQDGSPTFQRTMKVISSCYRHTDGNRYIEIPHEKLTSKSYVSGDRLFLSVHVMEA